MRTQSEPASISATIASRAVARADPETRAIPVWWIVRLFVASRLLATALVTVARYHARPASLADSGGGIGPTWFSPWTFFDGSHYVDIARSGYATLSTVYSPLYPLMLKLGGSNRVHLAVIGIAISLACFAASLPILYDLVAREHGDQVAKYTLIVLSFLPCSALWGAVYTESLALLLLVGTWWLVRTGKWAQALVPAALCGLTRNFGVVFAGALAIELFQQERERRAVGAASSGRAALIRRFLVCCTPAFTSIGFMAWVYSTFGSGAGILAQKAFMRGFAWPWWAVWKDISGLGTSFTFGELFSLLAIMLSAYFAIRYRTVVRWGSFVLVLGVLAMHLVMARQRPPYTIGAARYIMPTFPFSIALGLAGSRVSKVVRIPLALLLGLFCVMGSIAFGMSTFEHG